MSKKLSVLQNFKSSQLVRDPFPYVVIEQALPLSTYEKLAESYPSLDLVFEHRRDNQPGSKMESNHRYDIPASFVLKNSPDFGLWRDFVQYHTSQDFLDEFIDKFGECIKTSQPGIIEAMSAKSPSGHPRAGLRRVTDRREDCEIALDCQVGVNSPVTAEPSSVRSAHLDSAVELYAGLFYCRNPGDKSEGGDLMIYGWKDDKRSLNRGSRISLEDVIVKDKVPYGANKLALFINGIDAVHGVSPRHRTDYPRRLVNIIGEIYPTADRLFDIERYRQKPTLGSFVKQQIGRLFS